jgi:toxin ParE1/3/4
MTVVIAQFSGLRRFPVKGFEKYLLFYLSGSQGIDVIRVVHGARDIGAIFEIEEG